MVNLQTLPPQPAKTNQMKKKTKDPLETLPSIGPAMAADLHLLGIHSPEELVGQNPQQLYDELCSITGQHQDRCVLYVFRCAVWAAENPDSPDKALRNWWEWKERAINEQAITLVGAAEYQRTQETLAFMKLVALGDEDIRAGKTRPVDEFAAAMRAKISGSTANTTNAQK